jgi:hypothetical protein
MFTVERSGTSAQASRVLHGLELSVMWLWSSEPCCDLTVRPAVLERLGDVSMSIEQLMIRHEFRPDDVIDPDELASCASEVDDLRRHWPR